MFMAVDRIDTGECRFAENCPLLWKILTLCAVQGLWFLQIHNHTYFDRCCTAAHYPVETKLPHLFSWQRNPKECCLIMVMDGNKTHTKRYSYVLRHDNDGRWRGFCVCTVSHLGRKLIFPALANITFAFCTIFNKFSFFPFSFLTSRNAAVR